MDNIIKFDALAYAGRRILALGAHPGDIELGAGGTVALLTGSGALVTMAVISVPSPRATLMAESECAARLLGAQVRFLNPECEMRIEDVSIKKIAAQIRALIEEIQPAVILTHAPANSGRERSVYEACVMARGLSAIDLLCFNTTACGYPLRAFKPDAYVDISGSITKKMGAIKYLKSKT